ncbi:MAG: cupredoxin domain-containing protein [Candidatus Micrarchaeota archaeon]|nr:cupredoxin domain-containing protein [Candidatus Micrarchaeota archaeon]
MDNTKIAFLAVLVLAFAGVGFMLFSGSGNANAAAYAQGNGNYRGGCGSGGCGMMDIDRTIPESSGAQPSASGQVTGQQTGELQVISIHATSAGTYDNPSVTVKAGVPVRLDFTADPGSGCGAQLILDGVGTPVNLVSRNGQTVSATFTPPAPGEYRYHCGMNMFRGVLVVT